MKAEDPRDRESLEALRESSKREAKEKKIGLIQDWNKSRYTEPCNCGTEGKKERKRKRERAPASGSG